MEYIDTICILMMVVKNKIHRAIKIKIDLSISVWLWIMGANIPSIPNPKHAVITAVIKDIQKSK